MVEFGKFSFKDFITLFFAFPIVIGALFLAGDMIYGFLNTTLFNLTGDSSHTTVLYDLMRNLDSILSLAYYVGHAIFLFAAFSVPVDRTTVPFVVLMWLVGYAGWLYFGSTIISTVSSLITSNITNITVYNYYDVYQMAPDLSMITLLFGGAVIFIRATRGER